MSGIFGWITTDKSNIPSYIYTKGIKELFLLSETRGKEASGVCYFNQNETVVYKECVRAKKLIESQIFRNIMDRASKGGRSMLLGHARMITKGERNFENNQPVVNDDLICVHSGTIVNDEQIWKNNPDMERNAEVDTEAFVALLKKHGYENDLLQAFRIALNSIEGSMTVAVLDSTSNYCLLYTNTGSLYTVVSKDKSMFLFAGERYFLETMIKKQKLECFFKTSEIRQIPAKKGVLIDFATGLFERINLVENQTVVTKGNIIRKRKYLGDNLAVEERLPKIVYQSRLTEVEKLLNFNQNKIQLLRRCTKCLLPETFPGIQFDEYGKCSICKAYQKKTVKGEDELRHILKESKTKERQYDCLIPISGGRDSCYMLHYVVKELGLRPITYTYEWGIGTELASRNIQRMCSELKVEHILISADIEKKRKNVHMNVNAWLKNPSLATIPLFMAGDKQFFYYAQQLKRQTRTNNILFGMNSLEETQFKVRFANMQNYTKDDISYNLSNKNKWNLFLNYGMEFLKNPAYINRSLFDSLTGFISYYLLPKDFIQFFDYIKWEQKKIESVILNEYGWEKARGVDETWRIGDGTSPFYNYIYYKMAGFTEFDTFKSNQIREGMLDREIALDSLKNSNHVSAEAFIWYCDAIHIDPITAIKIINKQKTLYDK